MRPSIVKRIVNKIWLVPILALARTPPPALHHGSEAAYEEYLR